LLARQTREESDYSCVWLGGRGSVWPAQLGSGTAGSPVGPPGSQIPASS
jgi:hypothetical protein